MKKLGMISLERGSELSVLRVKNTLLFLFAALSLPVLAEARIGEARAEIIKRFGQPIGADDGDPHLAAWRLNDLLFTVMFDNRGISVMETLAPTKPFEKITATQREKFLKSHLGDQQTWRTLDVSIGDSIYPFGSTGLNLNPMLVGAQMRSDDQAIAIISKIESKIQVYSKSGTKFLMEWKRRNEEKSAVKF
ncbi:hypothetical protein [Horticoccus sp. 23ND18S-11]|uniref:hypothetical protein n=1 Tax=Horticoccus sp. 23ND18S-11 TaxID=3391832 RepID=UPI0039C8C759